MKPKSAVFAVWRVSYGPSSSSVFMLPKKLSIGALSQQSPLRLIEHSMPCSSSRRRYAWAAYWADSSGRRNTVFAGRQNQLIKRLCRRFPVEGLAGPPVEGSGHSGNFLGTVHAEIGAFREILAQQPVGVLV